MFLVIISRTMGERFSNPERDGAEFCPPTGGPRQHESALLLEIGHRSCEASKTPAPFIKSLKVAVSNRQFPRLGMELTPSTSTSGPFLIAKKLTICFTPPIRDSHED
jgi:hypothetical protein